MRRADSEFRKKAEEEAELRAQLRTWVKLFSSDINPGGYIELAEVRTTTGNIAGVNVPLFEEAVFRRAPVDLFETPAWLDDALDLLEKLVGLRWSSRIWHASATF